MGQAAEVKTGLFGSRGGQTSMTPTCSMSKPRVIRPVVGVGVILSTNALGRDDGEPCI
jgi:hypothetical protein